MSRTKNRSLETHYDVLRLTRGATTAEIVSAYHAAKNAFSGESVATYSLFSNDESKIMIARLDEAYITLSNVEKKREYDQWLNRRLEDEQELDPTRIDPATAEASPDLGVAGKVTVLADTQVTGSTFRHLRESRGLGAIDVARITKIPVKFIEAIENDEPSVLPARVYLQGFIKNLAVLYHIDPKTSASSYLSRFTDTGKT